ncbi:hypothetical protein ACT89R_01770 [Rhodococcus qingshengii]
MSTDEREPYRSGPFIKTGDRVAVDIGGEVIVGTARVESDDNSIEFIPDGEPLIPARDWITALTNWMESSESGSYSVSDESTSKPPVEPIPYDEMRRLCGLPDVRPYVAQRELARLGKQLSGTFQQVGEIWTEALDKMLPGLQAISETMKPKQAPPMWAIDISKQKRDTRSGWRVK